MRILIVGAGAVGGYLGARLIQAAADVTFLVRQGRAASLEKNGLVVIDANGVRTAIAATTVAANQLHSGWDLVLLATKATTLEPALDDVAPAITARTAILPIVNGIDHINTLTRRFGSEMVLGGVAVIGTELRENGDIQQLAPGVALSIGELNGRLSARVTEIADLGTRAGIDATASDHIVQDMWEKWLFMAAGGAATVLLGGVVGVVVAASGGTSVTQQVINEIASVQRAEGFPPRPAALERVTTILTQPHSRFATSMYRDFSAGRPTEVEPILGALVQRAQHRGVRVPLLEAAAVRLRVYENGWA
ncbi:2-dehydropantoate 2-reductase [Microbacterium arabinogalactanolyticum]|uniref:2-dehydropantoate 2-reductase n=1 Tax=Microbacterium arabinogalactanolyticum TaxID=69365 RepID=UPI002553D097|nr:2-dehydropantoate 2-reductase [Microbacterium arabinogalactanolyticum]GLC85528.1 2-dehydropantoate 2-reductase [Microbacterium arabinogalactanolyticum]